MNIYIFVNVNSGPVHTKTHIFISVHTKTIIVYAAFSPVHTKTLVNA